jgi:hypothetical protein
MVVPQHLEYRCYLCSIGPVVERAATIITELADRYTYSDLKDCLYLSVHSASSHLL